VLRDGGSEFDYIILLYYFPNYFLALGKQIIPSVVAKNNSSSHHILRMRVIFSPTDFLRSSTLCDC